MEIPYERLKDFENNPVKDVKLEFRNTRTRKPVLNSVVGDLSQYNTTSKLFQGILNSAGRLQQLEVYRQVQLKFKPGQERDQAVVIYDFKEKWPYFITASHFLTKNGGAMLQVRAGLRNTFGVFDKLTFEYNKSLQSKANCTYNLQLDFPYLASYGSNLSFALQYQQRPLGKAVEEFNYNFQTSFRRNERESFTLENTTRWNAIDLNSQHPQSAFYFRNEDFLPTQKLSIAYQRVLQNTLARFLNVEEGRYVHCNAELTVPWASQAQFAKSEFNFRQFYPLRALGGKRLNLEFAISVGFVKALEIFQQRSVFNTNTGIGQPIYNKKQLNINDCFFGNGTSIRGFSELDGFVVQDEEREVLKKQLDNFDFYFKNANKINIYNYPGLKKANVTAFLHFSQGFFCRSRNGEGTAPFHSTTWSRLLQNHLRASAGMGLSFDVGSGAKLEFVYNFLLRGRAQDTSSKLQLRLALDD